MDINNLKNSIDVPTNELNNIIKDSIKRGEKYKYRRKNVRLKKIGGWIAAVFVLVSVIGIMNPKAVSAIPLIGSIFSHFSDVDKIDKFEDFSQSVNKTVESNGVKVTVNDIALDNNILAITTTIVGEDIDGAKGIMGNIYLDGHLMKSRNNKYVKIDDKTTEYILYGNVSDIKLGDEVNIEIDFKYIDDIKGDWNLKFSTNKEKANSLSKTIEVNEKIKLPTSELKIENVVISPFGSSINYSGTYYEKSKSRNPEIKGFRVTDNNGKVLGVKFAGSTSSDIEYSGKFEILNNLWSVDGISIVPILDYEDNEIYKKIGEYRASIYQCNVNDIDKKQSIIENRRKATAEEKKAGYAYDEVVKVFSMDNKPYLYLNDLLGENIQLNRATNVKVDSIKTLEDRTLITMKIEGNYSYCLLNGVFSSFLLLDEDGNYYEIDLNNGKEAIIDAENNLVLIELPVVDNNKKYKIAMPKVQNPIVEDSYKINVSIK